MNSHESDIPADDEISFLDIVRFFIDNAWWIAVSTIGCGLLGLGLGFLAPKQYESSMSIQMALVVNVPVETPALLLEKSKLPLYFSPNTLIDCEIDSDLIATSTLAKKFNPVLNKQAPLVSFSYKGSSPNAAKKCLESVFTDIREKQNLLAEPIIKQKKISLETLKSKLSAAEQVTKYLNAQKQSILLKDERFSANALVLATSFNKENEFKDLRNAISELEISLGKPLTQETQLAAPIYVSDQAVFPNKMLFLGMALILGLFLGVLSVWVRTMWLSTREKLVLRP